jgi:hypothetical protein
MPSLSTIQVKINAMSPGVYELRQIMGIAHDAACPGPTGVYVSRHVQNGGLKHIRRVQGTGPNGSNIYEIF